MPSPLYCEGTSTASKPSYDGLLQAGPATRLKMAAGVHTTVSMTLFAFLLSLKPPWEAGMPSELQVTLRITNEA